MAKLVTLAKGTGAAGTKAEGDPVATYDDSRTLGRKEDIRVWVAQGNDPRDFPDQFYVIDVPGMPIASAERIIQQWRRPSVDGDPNWDAPDQPDRFEWLGPYRWQFGVADKLPAQIKNRLRRDRFIVLEPYDQTLIDTINNYVIDRTGLDVLITPTPIDPQAPARAMFDIPNAVRRALR